MSLGSVLSFSRRALIAGAVAAAALLACGGREAAAAPISMTLSFGGSDFVLDGFAVATNTSYTISDFNTLNAALAGSGLAFEFTSLGASSNFPGSSVGRLDSNLDVRYIGGDFSTFTLSVTEDGYTSPSGPTGTLQNTVAQSFSGDAAASQSAMSTYNSISTPGVTYASTGTAPNSNSQDTSTAIPAFSVPYALTNVHTLTMSTVGGTASSSVKTTVSATAVPEPVSVLSLGIGLSISLLAVLRNRRSRAHSA